MIPLNVMKKSVQGCSRGYFFGRSEHSNTNNTIHLLQPSSAFIPKYLITNEGQTFKGSIICVGCTMCYLYARCSQLASRAPACWHVTRVNEQ
jgi:hypothetical protein